MAVLEWIPLVGLSALLGFLICSYLYVHPLQMATYAYASTWAPGTTTRSSSARSRPRSTRRWTSLPAGPTRFQPKTKPDRTRSIVQQPFFVLE